MAPTEWISWNPSYFENITRNRDFLFAPHGQNRELLSHQHHYYPWIHIYEPQYTCLKELSYRMNSIAVQQHPDLQASIPQHHFENHWYRLKWNILVVEEKFCTQSTPVLQGNILPSRPVLNRSNCNPWWMLR